MTTYGEAIQMGLGSNLTASVSDEIQCAGQALSGLLRNEELIKELPDAAKPILSHVFTHLLAIRQIVDMVDEYYEEEVVKFNEENPGKLVAVTEELGELPIIKKLQEHAGMDADMIAAVAIKNVTDAMNIGKQDDNDGN